MTYRELETLVDKYGPKIVVKAGDRRGFLVEWDSRGHGTARVSFDCVRDIVHASGLTEMVPDAVTIAFSIADLEAIGVDDGMACLRLMPLLKLPRGYR